MRSTLGRNRLAMTLTRDAKRSPLGDPKRLLKGLLVGGCNASGEKSGAKRHNRRRSRAGGLVFRERCGSIRTVDPFSPVLPLWRFAVPDRTPGEFPSSWRLL